MEKEIIDGEESVVVHDFNFVGHPFWEGAELILHNYPNGLFYSTKDINNVLPDSTNNPDNYLQIVPYTMVITRFPGGRGMIETNFLVEGATYF